MSGWRVDFGVEVPGARSAEEATERAEEFVRYLLARKREGHPALNGVNPIFGLAHDPDREPVTHFVGWPEDHERSRA